MAVGPVIGEPLSDRNSLINRENTGIFTVPLKAYAG
jgi:hypothetical protein